MGNGEEFQQSQGGGGREFSSFKLLKDQFDL